MQRANVRSFFIRASNGVGQNMCSERRGWHPELRTWSPELRVWRWRVVPATASLEPARVVSMDAAVLTTRQTLQAEFGGPSTEFGVPVPPFIISSRRALAAR